MKKCIIFILIASMLLSLAACSGNNSEPDVSEQKSLAEELGLTKETKVATENTIKINSALYTQLDFADTQEAAFATKGLIDAPETLELKDADGHVVWSQSAYSFLEDYEKAPTA